MFKAIIYVRYVESVVNPDVEVLKETVEKLSMDTVKGIQLGRTYEISIQESSREQAEKTAEELAEKLIVNPSMETYTLLIEEA